MYQYNLSEKLDHIAYMFNVRTNGKAYENFIVNAIYTKVNNSELIPVTQQYVKDTINDKYYFIDLYFPQINFGIEIDEMQHNDEKNQENDKIREDYITSAIECEIERIPIYKKTNDQWQKRTYNEICEDINQIVDKINTKIEEKGGIKWETNEERKNAVINRGVFNINDNVYYSSITEILEICGKKIKQARRCGYTLNNDDYLWVPKLTVDSNKNDNNFNNFLNDGGKSITEKNEKGNFPNADDEKQKRRVVFMRIKDIFGKNAIKFVGVFKLDKNLSSKKRVFKRISTVYPFKDTSSTKQKVQKKYNKKS